MITTNRTKHEFGTFFKGLVIKRGQAWGFIIIGALLAFEMFNYSTTQFALNDVLGSLTFAGIRWATILALAFCGIDFAGIARLFTPEQGREEPAETWYLFGAWVLAAAMNAALTWWGVAVAIASHTNLSSEVISATTLTKVVPVFVAIMVLLIRVLIIGTFSVKGEKLFSQAERHNLSRQPVMQPLSSMTPRPMPASLTPFRPAAKAARSEPSYHNVALQSRSVREAEYTDPPRNA
jgi:hypothetical protein